MALPVPGTTGAVVVVGAPAGELAEVVTAVRSTVNQVALALEVSAAHRDLERRARTDPLTGLANSAAFRTALDGQLRDGDPGWLLLVDLDDFKAVNDRLGHLAGDQLLTRLAGRLAGVVRAGDLCARLGGDEFAVLLRGAGEEQARTVGQRVVDLVSRPVRLEEGTARVGASVGLTAVRSGDAARDVVRRADGAMYAAKHAGKDRVEVDTTAPQPPGRGLVTT
ncbi:GGDEF domain-containing protein [Geodermatophilus sp. DSM 44513]|uniref:GGDEF domain-containing protein n=1 Tax=Geodermatophilus sp. DSM 44513 TaxID=1528104 RepID=UPI00127F51CE|nr:GGDEF domain-containing protein [Geodermatophilus sp. DSM 44513]WNV77542.1 GGDEF domain-containing protein [Geodermatophilus sp. DSM 44513]